MKTIFSLLLTGCIYWLNAQLTITTNLREDGVFNKATMNWEINSTTEGLTVFNFNESLTSFRHITGNISSTYTINDWEYSEEEILYNMTLTSDVGNEYEFLIDGINQVAIFFYYDQYGRYCMVRHYIQDSYFDE